MRNRAATMSQLSMPLVTLSRTGKSFPVNPGEVILDAALRQGDMRCRMPAAAAPAARARPKSSPAPSPMTKARRCERGKPPCAAKPICVAPGPRATSRSISPNCRHARSGPCFGGRRGIADIIEAFARRRHRHAQAAAERSDPVSAGPIYFADRRRRPIARLLDRKRAARGRHARTAYRAHSQRTLHRACA